MDYYEEGKYNIEYLIDNENKNKKKTTIIDFYDHEIKPSDLPKSMFKHMQITSQNSKI